MEVSNVSFDNGKHSVWTKPFWIAFSVHWQLLENERADISVVSSNKPCVDVPCKFEWNIDFVYFCLCKCTCTKCMLPEVMLCPCEYYWRLTRGCYLMQFHISRLGGFSLKYRRQLDYAGFKTIKNLLCKCFGRLKTNVNLILRITHNTFLWEILNVNKPFLFMV